MPKKKQYIVPSRLHYDVFRRDEYAGRLEIEYVCTTQREHEAAAIAASLAKYQSHVAGRSFVVRAKPTEAHNTLKFYTNDEFKAEEWCADAEREYLTAELGQRVIQASINGNGRPSPTVVKAVQKVLH